MVSRFYSRRSLVSSVPLGLLQLKTFVKPDKTFLPPKLSLLEGFNSVYSTQQEPKERFFPKKMFVILTNQGISKTCKKKKSL